MMGLHRWNQKGGTLQTGAAEALLCLKSGRYGLRKNFGIQLQTHDSAHIRMNSDNNKIVMRTTGLTFSQNIW